MSLEPTPPTPQPTAPTVDAAPASRRSSRPDRLLLAIAAAAILLIGGWYAFYRINLANEKRAAEAISELGALVVMDGNGQHVASVNLSAIESPESLAKAIEYLPALRQLGSLDASRTKIRDEQLAFVAQLSALTTLTLNETAIGDEGVEPLADLVELRILDLSATPVTGNFEPLLSLPQLEWLVLRELKLADDALPKLQGMATLKRLGLEGSEYPGKSLSTLLQASPTLSVDR